MKKTISVFLGVVCMVWGGTVPLYGQDDLPAPKLSEEDFNAYIMETRKYRDPFLPLLGDDKKTPNANAVIGKLKLQGIVWDPISPMVVISGEIYQTGDTVDGAVVSKIDKDRVFLTVDDKTFSLIFWEEEGGNSGKKK